MGKRSIRVAIINDPAREECDASCGTDWSLPDTLALVRRQIKERFGDDVQLTYTDIGSEKTGSDVIKLNEMIESKHLSVPLLLLNGNVRITGNFDIRQMMDAIEVESEIGV